MSGKSDGAFTAVKDRMNEMLCSGVAVAAFASGLAMTTILDTADASVPPDSDENYRCDACDQVDRDGLFRMVGGFEVVTWPEPGMKGTLRVVDLGSKDLEDILLSTVSQPRVITLIYVCASCRDEVRKEIESGDTNIVSG